MESSSPTVSQHQTMLTCADLAARWGVDIKTIYDSITRGELPAVRLGRRVVRIALAVVERIEVQGRVEQPGVKHGR